MDKTNDQAQDSEIVKMEKSCDGDTRQSNRVQLSPHSHNVSEGKKGGVAGSDSERR